MSEFKPFFLSDSVPKINIIQAAYAISVAALLLSLYKFLQIELSTLHVFSLDKQ